MSDRVARLERANKLRRGGYLGFYDSMLWWKAGEFKESSMGLCLYEGHYFTDTRPTWKEVLRWIKSGRYT